MRPSMRATSTRRVPARTPAATCSTKNRRASSISNGSTKLTLPPPCTVARSTSASISIPAPSPPHSSITNTLSAYTDVGQAIAFYGRSSGGCPFATTRRDRRHNTIVCPTCSMAHPSPPVHHHQVTLPVQRESPPAASGPSPRRTPSVPRTLRLLLVGAIWLAARKVPAQGRLRHARPHTQSRQTARRVRY